jgi:hypothetical protein
LFGPYQLILIAVAVFLIWESSHIVKELDGIQVLLREIRDQLPRT